MADRLWPGRVHSSPAVEPCRAPETPPTNRGVRGGSGGLGHAREHVSLCPLHLFVPLCMPLGLCAKAV